MIEIMDGLFIAARHVVAVKATGKDECAVFMIGQSAVDGGFLVDRDALEVATDVAEELEEDEPDEDDDEDM